jgi:hypothetical protein
MLWGQGPHIKLVLYGRETWSLTLRARHGKVPCCNTIHIYADHFRSSAFTLKKITRHCAYSGIATEHSGCEAKSKSLYDRQSVGQSVLVSGASLGPATNFYFSLKFPLDSCGFVIL